MSINNRILRLNFPFKLLKRVDKKVPTWTARIENNDFAVSNNSSSHGKMSATSDPTGKGSQQDKANEEQDARGPGNEHDTLKYQLLGPSLTKAGQDKVDQQRVRFYTEGLINICFIIYSRIADNLPQVSEIIYNASKGSKFFNHERVRDQLLTEKIQKILAHKQKLEKQDLSYSTRQADEYIADLELRRDLSQWIVHIDCDAFFAAVEELDRPELRDVPMAVGKGVLTTCNYHARKFGCRSGMASFVAKKLCPQLICIPQNYDKYNAKAREIRAIFSCFCERKR